MTGADSSVQPWLAELARLQPLVQAWQQRLPGLQLSLRIERPGQPALQVDWPAADSPSPPGR